MESLYEWGGLQFWEMVVIDVHIVVRGERISLGEHIILVEVLRFWDTDKLPSAFALEI